MFTDFFFLKNAWILIFFCCCWKDLSFLDAPFKKFLNPHIVNLSVCLISFLAIASVKIRQWPVIFVMFLNYTCLVYKQKKCHCIVRLSFYSTLQKFQYINIFCSFFNDSNWQGNLYVFKVHRSDLHIKINHSIQYILFYRALRYF